MNQLIIGKNIVLARKSKGFSQAQLAQLLCVSKQAVGKWERGESMPDIIMLSRIAQIVGRKLDYFLELEGEGNVDEIRIAQDESARFLDMGMAKWRNADFSTLKNVADRVGCANIKNCKFVDVDLSKITFSANNLAANDFLRANFSNSRLRTSNVKENNFTQASLRGCTISCSNLSKNNFANADFTRANISNSTLSENNLLGAIFLGTEFRRCFVRKTEFSGQIEDCSFVECMFFKVVFKNATLKNVFFKAHSLKRVEFVNCSMNQLTYQFLKNANADLSNVLVVD